jgi:hypothetical protein
MLTSPEAVALWELSSRQDERLPQRFLDEAVRDPVALEQLRARCEPALIAAVGLDRERRDRAAGLFASWLHSRAIAKAQKVDVALVALELEDAPGSATEECGAIITEAITHEPPSALHPRWRDHLAAAQSRLEPRACARLLVDEIECERDAGFRHLLAIALADVCGRVEPIEAAHFSGRAAGCIVDALERASDDTARSSLAPAIGVLSDRLDATEAARLAARTTIILKRWTNAGAPHIAMVVTIGGLAARLEPVESAQVAGRLVNALFAALERAPDGVARNSLRSALRVSRLDPRAAGRLLQMLTTGFERATDSSDQDDLVSAFASMFERLEPAAAAEVAGQAARTLTRSLESATNATGRAALAPALTAVFRHLNPTEAAQSVTRVKAVLDHEKDFFTHARLASSLAAVAGQLEPAKARQVLTDALEREPEKSARYSLASELIAVCRRLRPAEALPLAGRISAALDHEEDAQVRWLLASAFVATARSLDALQAAQFAGHVARTLANALEREADPNARRALATGLGAAASLIERAEAARIGARLAAALEHQLDVDRGPLASVLAAVCNRLDPAEAARLCGESIRSLLRTRSAESITIDDHAEFDAAVSSLLGHMPTESANALAAKLCALSVAEVGYEVNEWSGQTRSGVSLRALLPERDRARDALDLFWVLAATPSAFGAGGVLTAFTGFTATPPRCRLTTQQLIDLLKMPTCYADGRRAVLDHLGYVHGRYFVNHWAFVRYAEGHGLKLDFTTPPKRPDPRESMKRMLEILNNPASSR